MAEVVKTCANCGNVQASGDFCEKCGTRMPAAVPIPPVAAPAVSAPVAAAAGAAAAGAAAYSAPRPAAPQAAAPPPYTPPQYGGAPQPQAAPQYGGGQYGAPPAGPGEPSYGYSQGKGFFSRLFDFSFREFITPSIIKILFIISIVVIGLGVLGGIITGFMAGAGTGVFLLIGGLIGGFLMVLYVRVLLELFIVFFRIHDDTADMAKRKR